jgi:acyl-CoA synthetase (AMP-forming)/AMP-acid ligase II
MQNFAQILQQTALETPERIAIYLLLNGLPARAITFGELMCGSAGYSHALAAAGVQPGEVVVLILNHSKDLVYAFYGAVLHGAIPAIMPFLTEKLSPDYYRASLAALFEITSPAAVITYPEFVEEVGVARSAIRCLLVSSQVSPSAKPDYSDRAVFGGLDRSPDDVVLLQHSSGTTGLQKGVALSHKAVFNQIESYAEALRLSPDDTIVSWLPLYHDMGLIAGFILPILKRVPLVLMSPFDWVRAPYKLMQAISTYRGTLCWLPNFAYNFCAQKVRPRHLEGVDLSSLRAVINCSEPMHWKSHQAFLERFRPYGLRPEALATCYAMAENVFAVTQGGLDKPVTQDRVNQHALLTRQAAEPAQDDSLAVKLLSAGRPIRNTHLRVLDANGQDLPDRRVGEIALLSDCMLTGYYHRPDLTENAFQDGWYLTGDLGYLAGGELYITGRKKDLIIVGGKNIYPQDLERLANEVEGVHPGRVVAFGMFDEQAGTEEVVIVAETDDEDIGRTEHDSLEQGKADAIAEEIRQRVTRGSDVALRYVKIVGRNWLLKTSSGKIARQANHDKYMQESAL